MIHKIYLPDFKTCAWRKERPTKPILATPFGTFHHHQPSHLYLALGAQLIPMMILNSTMLQALFMTAIETDFSTLWKYLSDPLHNSNRLFLLACKPTGLLSSSKWSDCTQNSPVRLYMCKYILIQFKFERLLAEAVVVHIKSEKEHSPHQKGRIEYCLGCAEEIQLINLICKTCSMIHQFHNNCFLFGPCVDRIVSLCPGTLQQTQLQQTQAPENWKLSVANRYQKPWAKFFLHRLLNWSVQFKICTVRSLHPQHSNCCPKKLRFKSPTSYLMPS